MVALCLGRKGPEDEVNMGRASHRHEGEVHMLSSFKNKAAEQDRNPAANADELVGRTVQQSLTLVEQVASEPEPMATRKPGPTSCIGSDMSIVGKIECNGPAQVLGRIEGEVRASDL